METEEKVQNALTGFEKTGQQVIPKRKYADISLAGILGPKIKIKICHTKPQSPLRSI
jgi:hypothetical protein